jgi:ABC-type transporter Mla subunit MlaD
MSHAGPLGQGSKVRVAGLVVGQVQAVRFLPRPKDGARVALRLWIDPRRAHLVRVGSDFFVSQQALLSEPYLEVGVPEHRDPGEPVTDGAVVRGVDPASIDWLLGRSYQTLHELDRTVNEDFPEFDALSREVSALEATLDALAGNQLTGGAALVAEVERSQEWLAEVARSSGSPARTANRLRTTVVRASASLQMLRERLALVASQLDAARQRIDTASGADLELVVQRVDALTVELDRLIESGDELVALIDRGQGAISAFAADLEIFDQVKQLTKVMKQRPWELVGHD